MNAGIKQILLGLIILSILFGLLEKLFPAIKNFKKDKKELFVDLIYWFVTPLLTKSFQKLAVIFMVIGLMPVIGYEFSPEHLEGRGPIKAWPLGAQILITLLVGDYIGYWMHRIFHGKKLWKFHAIHHSSENLNWISSVRLHPINDVLNRLPAVFILLILGLPVKVAAAYLPFLPFYAILVHANVPWSFGPLKYVIASPRFHRWHHTSEKEGLNKNFAGLFPFIDLMFGTYYLPKNKQPQTFGLSEEKIPNNFLKQMLHPFK